MPIRTAEPGVFRQTFSTHFINADASGLLRLTALLDLLQTQAGEHTLSRGFSFHEHRQQEIFWVLSRLTVRVDAWPQPPCPVVVDTWARATKALFALRDYRFGVEGQDWCGKASSAWILLKDRRPQRPEPWVAIYDQVRPEEPASELPVALPALETAASADLRAEPLVRLSHSVRADWEDLDVNEHVNHVNAVGWCLAQHETDFLLQWRPEFLEVNFLAEMFSGECFAVRWEPCAAPEGRLGFDYLVTRDADGNSTLRMRIIFRLQDQSRSDRQR